MSDPVLETADPSLYQASRIVKHWLQVIAGSRIGTYGCERHNGDERERETKGGIPVEIMRDCAEWYKD